MVGLVSIAAIPAYAQGMGATDNNGFVLAFPLSPSAALPSTVLDAQVVLSGTGLTVSTLFSGTFTIGQKLFNKSTGVIYGTILSGSGSSWVLDTNNGSLGSVEVAASPGAQQFFCDTVNGNNISYNGLSPYPGFQMNGTGPNFQSGATGQGSANLAYGPLESYFAAFSKILINQFYQTGNQIFLAQGQTFNEGGAIFTGSMSGTTTLTVTVVQNGFVEAGLWLNFTGISGSPTIVKQLTSTAGGGVRGGAGTYQVTTSQTTSGSVSMIAYPSLNNFGVGLNNRFGESIAYPLCIQSYDNTGVGAGAANSLNTATQGRATGANRPLLQTLSLPSSFTGSISNGSGGAGTTLVIDAGSLVGPVPRLGQYLTCAGVDSNVFITAVTNSSTFTINVPYLIADLTAMLTSGYGQPHQTLQTSQVLNPTTNGQVQGNWVVRGLNFTGIYAGGNTISIGGNAYNVLIENCIFSNGGFGFGSTATSGFGFFNQYNIIFRHLAAANNWVNKSPPGASCYGTGFANKSYIEDCVAYQGGWKPGANGREEAIFTASMTGGTLSVLSAVSGTIAIGQTFQFTNGTTGFITGGSGTSWTTSSAATVASLLCLTSNYYAPNSEDHGMYLAHGANNYNDPTSNGQLTVRRCVVIDSSATGFSGRGNLRLYNNVSINNPIHMTAGGSSNSPPPAIASIASGTVSGTLLTVITMNTPPVWNTYIGTGAVPTNSSIFPSQSTTLLGTGLTGSPKVLSQVTPLLAGESLGGVGRYNLSVSQSALGPQAFTTSGNGYVGENPGGVLINYHDNFLLGGQAINDLNFDGGGGIYCANGILGGSMIRNLLANDNVGYSSGISYMFQPDAAYDWPSNINLVGNTSYNWTPLLNVAASNAAFPSDILTTFNGGASPGNNNNNHWTVSSGSYDSSTGVVSLTLAAPVTFSAGMILIMSLTGTGADINLLKQGNDTNPTLYTATVASGTNVQFNIGAGHTITTITGGDLSYSPASSTQVYNALGYPDLPTMAAAIIAAPEQNWAYQILSTGRAMFGFPFELGA